MAGKIERPDVLESSTRKMKTGWGTLYVVISEKDSKPFEIFAIIGKSGGDLNSITEAIGRLVSLALRYDIPISDIISQLEGITGSEPLMVGKRMIKSIPDAISFILEEKYGK